MENDTLMDKIIKQTDKVAYFFIHVAIIAFCAKVIVWAVRYILK